MFERFTDRARRVVVLAQEEARLLNHNYIGTEHILLGLAREDEGVAAKALAVLGVSLGEIRADVRQIVGEGQAAPAGHIPFTSRAKKILELSLREAIQLGHSYIGTEHILLGLAREGEGVAAQVLQKRGVDLNRVKQTVMQLLSGYKGEAEISVPAGAEPVSERRTEVVLDPSSSAPADFPTCSSCFAALAEHARLARLELEVEGEPRSVDFVYCGRCGTTLGIAPG